jgi:hypothetical protein
LLAVAQGGVEYDELFLGHDVLRLLPASRFSKGRRKAKYGIPGCLSQTGVPQMRV